MQNYQKLYAFMFNAATNALRQIREENYSAARDILERAQRQTEEMYIAQEEADEALEAAQRAAQEEPENPED